MHAASRLLTVAAAGTLAAAPAVARSSAWRTITTERASGSRVIVVAAASTSRPRGLALRVSSRPRQRVRGQWLVTCRRGRRSRSRRGTFSDRTPLRRTLAMGYARPAHCRISASAQLSSRGRVALTLLRR